MAGKLVLDENGLKEMGIEVVDIPSNKEVKEPEQRKEEVVPSQRTETPRETKKEIMREFNENPRTREYGAKLVDKRFYVFLWIISGILILLVLLFAVDMVWGKVLLSKFSEKDFSVNVNPSDVNVTDADTNNIFNNYTIINNVTIPSNITVNCRFINSS
jgi:hypothetical protein